MVAVFWKWLAGKLDNFFTGQLQSIYWMIFWLVYIVGWSKGLSSVPVGSFAFRLVLWLGLGWFLIIGIVYLKTFWQVGKRE